MILVRDITRGRTASGAQLRATIECRGTSLDGAELWFDYPGEYSEHLSETAHPWIAALLRPAMKLQQPLRVTAPASPKFLGGVEQLMEIFHRWDDTCPPVPIQVEPLHKTISPGSVSATFFSGGVDSFYTLLNNHAAFPEGPGRISHLLFVRGFDISLGDDELYHVALESVRAVSGKLGATLVPCATNLRGVVPGKLIPWEMYFGQALASVALGLERLLGAVYISAGLPKLEMTPRGSHPLTDPLWSTESTRIIHSGADKTRLEKVISQIAGSDVALEHLRVCWENRHGKYNCGECEKCIRTMLNLKLAGVLDKCRTFDRDLSYADIAKVPLHGKAARALMRENYDAAVAMGSDPELIRAIRRCISPWKALRPRELPRSLWYRVLKVLKPLDRRLFGGRLRRFYRGGQ